LYKGDYTKRNELTGFLRYGLNIIKIEIKNEGVTTMEKLYLKYVVVLAVFSIVSLSANNSIANETGGVIGNSYMTFSFIDHRFDIDILTFEADGTFVMLRKDGVGTYTYNAPIFDIEWTTADGTTTYNFTGVSLVGLVIAGWGGELTTSTHGCRERGNYFFGINSDIIPD
jgi:hypothetical protein